MACNSSDILATAYRNGYAKLSERDLKVAAIAAACSSSCNAQVLIETAVSLGYLKLTEYEAAECIASALCSSPGASGAPAPTILQIATTNHLASMSRRDLDAVITAVLCKQTNPPCVTPTAPVSSAGAKSIGNTSFRIVWSQPANTGSLITSYTIKWGTVSGVYPNTVTIPVIPRVYDLTGLTAGTQYFWVVVANAFAGCSSANSNEGSATTTGNAPGNHLLNGLVSYWQIDGALGIGHLGDDSEDGNPAAVAGGVVGVTGGPIAGTGFFGSGGVLTINPAPANLKLGAGVSFTAQIWVLSGNFNVNFQSLFGQYNAILNASAWVLIALNGKANMNGYHASVGTGFDVGTLNNNQWNHVVVGFDSANQQMFGQVNGAARVTQAEGDLQSVTTAILTASDANGGHPFTGGTAQAGFWNRVLSTADVAALYNGGAGLPFSSFTP